MGWGNQVFEYDQRKNGSNCLISYGLSKRNEGRAQSEGTLDPWFNKEVVRDWI